MSFMSSFLRVFLLGSDGADGVVEDSGRSIAGSTGKLTEIPLLGEVHVHGLALQHLL